MFRYHQIRGQFLIDKHEQILNKIYFLNVYQNFLENTRTLVFTVGKNNSACIDLHSPSDGFMNRRKSTVPSAATAPSGKR